MTQRMLFCTSVFREDINSAGRHMIDLVREFDCRGFSCEVITNIGYQRTDMANTKVRSLELRLEGISKPLRLLYEIYTPIALFLKYFASPRNDYTAAVCFSPSIFWYLYLKLVGRRIRGEKILILRDIFPLWLADVGILLPTGVVYRFLNYFCRKQLESYDVILVQHANDVKVLQKNYSIDCKIDVLHNWYCSSPKLTVSDEIIEFCERGAFTLAVVGNFGPAQDLKNSCKLLGTILQEFADVRILFIGQGIEAKRYFANYLNTCEGRIRFENKMSHDEVINALAYADAGYFSLDKKNQQGHLPGKVLAYLMAGLPVFGLTGFDAPVSKMIKYAGIGIVSHSNKRAHILKDFFAFKSQDWPNREIKKNTHDLFSSERAFNKLAEHIGNE